MTSVLTQPGPIYHFARGGSDRGDCPLVLGFAYSLSPDGTPGLYNRILAETIIGDWAGRDAWIGVQWEIKDAMDEPDLATTVSNQLQPHKPATDVLLKRLVSPGAGALPNVYVAPPFDPILAQTDKGEDALDWRMFRQLLVDSLGATGDPEVAKLANAMAETAGKRVAAPNDAEVLRKAISSPWQLAI